MYPRAAFGASKLQSEQQPQQVESLSQSQQQSLQQQLRHLSMSPQKLAQHQQPRHFSASNHHKSNGRRVQAHSHYSGQRQQVQVQSQSQPQQQQHHQQQQNANCHPPIDDLLTRRHLYLNTSINSSSNNNNIISNDARDAQLLFQGMLKQRENDERLENQEQHQDEDEEKEEEEDGDIEDELAYRDQLRQRQLLSQYHAQRVPPLSSLKASQSSQIMHQSDSTSLPQTQKQATTTSSQQGIKQQVQQQPAPQHVNFGLYQKTDVPEQSERKKKYLTAKYGQHQMNLIKKRLKVEMWLHDELQELAKQTVGEDSQIVDDIEIDLDELLDMEDDSTRVHWLQKTLKPLNNKASDANKVNNFIATILEQAKLL